jgi:hypothetical protein
MTNSTDRVEIITSVQRRRRWTAPETAGGLCESRQPGAPFRIVRGIRREYADAPHRAGLLRSRRERPRRRTA